MGGEPGGGPGSRGGAPRTLRMRLTLVTGGLLAAALAIGAALLVQVLSAGRISDLDAAVTSRVTTVADLVRADRIPAALGVVQPGEVVQVLDPAGGVVATSANASLTLPVVDAEVLRQLVERSAESAANAGTAGDAGVVVLTAPSAYAGTARVAAVVLSGADLPGAGADQPAVEEPGAEDLIVVAAVPLGEVSATVRALTTAFVIAVPVLAVGTALLVWFVLGRALRGVEELRQAADAVAHSGGPGSLPVPRTGELAALATTLNAMLDRLERAVVAEREAAQAAHAAADRQRAFVADAAHELRSPITSLVTALEVAQRHPASYPPAELVPDLARDVARVQELVEDLLLLARVGSRPLSPTALDLREIADGVARDHPRVTVAGGGVGWGDAAATARVLRNLVANAERHARTAVVVRVAPGVVEVSDDGAGIPAVDRERVFERFVRLDEARQRDAGGSGLGLAIARELAREQGGEVTLGQADGGGLRARVVLPVVAAAPTPAGPALA